MRNHGESDDSEITITAVYAGDRGYGAVLANLFRFFRAHADGKYTARTMNKLSSLPLAWEDYRASGRDMSTEFPFIANAAKPYSYDEDTEIKTGGKIGTAIAWSNGTTVIAVNNNARRKHVATALLEHVSAVYRPVLWVGRQNIPGQMLCLKSGLYVTAMNASGALRMAGTPMDEDGMEGDENENDRAQREAIRATRPRRRSEAEVSVSYEAIDYPPPSVPRLR